MTTETKHTPGMWRKDAGRILAGYAEHQETIAIVQRVESDAEFSANACLIAAAPDLLAALQELLTYDRVERPAFRNKPIGAPNSNERIKQDKLIQVEDMARAAIERATKG